MMSNGTAWPRKVYADGCDWIAVWLDHLSRNTPEGGNFFSLAAELEEGQDGETILRTAEQRLTPYLPMLNGHMGRDWTLAPCWRTGDAEPFYEEILSGISPEDSACEPLSRNFRLRLLRYGGKEFLLLTFSHRLFDGAGAELFLSMLLGRDDFRFRKSPGYTHPLLNEWKTQFEGGRIVQHFGHENPSSGILMLPRDGSGKIRFRTIILSAAETDRLRAGIEKECGPFSFSFRIMGELLFRFTEIFPEDERKNGFLSIPVTTGMRGTGTVPENPLFFNQWSFLPVLFPAKEAAAGKQAFESVRRSYLSAVGKRLPDAFRKAFRLVRIAPLFLMDRMFEQKKSETGSMMFSYIDSNDLPGIRNVVHLPVMPPVNGLGFFVNLYRGQLNLSVSCRGGSLSGPELDCFCDKLERYLRRTDNAADQSC